jgi:hypothetical protein
MAVKAVSGRLAAEDDSELPELGVTNGNLIEGADRIPDADRARRALR